MNNKQFTSEEEDTFIANISQNYINVSQQRNEIKILIKIFENILNDPYNKKYHDLNLNKIIKKMRKNTILIHVLYEAGFYKSKNGKRLFYDKNRLRHLRLIYNFLIQLLESSTTTQIINDDQDKIMNMIMFKFTDCSVFGYAFDMIKLHCGKHLDQGTNYLNLVKELILHPKQTYDISSLESSSTLAIKYNINKKMAETIFKEMERRNWNCVNSEFIRLHPMNAKKHINTSFNQFYNNNHSIGDMTFMDEMYKHVVNVGISDECINNLKILVQSEEFDSESIQLDYYDNNGNICTMINNKKCTQFINEFTKANNGINKDQSSNSSCKLDECLPLKIIGDVLNRYRVYTENVTENVEQSFHTDIIYEEIGNNYSVIDLLDDFNHLLIEHPNQLHYKYIYNALTNKIYNNNLCDSSTCIMMKRNRRNRSNITQNENKLNELYSNNDHKLIVEQQLLDRIHCYCLHPFRDIKRDDSIASSEMKQNYNKFSSFNEYSYGFRFFYWKYYENKQEIYDPAQSPSAADYIMILRQNVANTNSTLAQWYIKSKYINFKEEMLSNDICVIGEQQWTNLMHISDKHLRSENVKSMYCPRTESARLYEMHYGQQMSQNHLIAMRIYSEFDILQCKFTATFRRNSNDETDIELQKRHRNFYYLARLLRECVECFGTNKSAVNTTLYHGVDK
eukprot:70783_1